MARCAGGSPVQGRSRCDASGEKPLTVTPMALRCASVGLALGASSSPRRTYEAPGGSHGGLYAMTALHSPAPPDIATGVPRRPGSPTVADSIADLRRHFTEQGFQRIGGG